MRRLTHPLAPLALLMLLSACDRHGVYESNITIPRQGWHMDSLATFRPQLRDTAQLYNIYINIRNTTGYANSNLFLFITTQAPTGAVLRDTLEGILANPKGEWLGRGFGRIRDNQIPYRRLVRIPVEGEYTFRIQHGMRTDYLPEIVSVGIRVERSH